ncbi:MAG: hypothetical protein MUP58_02360 [Candidatus Nanohaloarchaeota archaeon QJJ-9]|nr:hypothetical protein [Candidatus Nanohaloarchaeota archaeon QJJ-9]
MEFLGLQIGYSLSAAISVAILAVLWDYSSLDEAQWKEITAGVMMFLFAAAINILFGSNGLAALGQQIGGIGQAVAVFNVIGGLLVLFGAGKNVYTMLSESM